MKEQQSTTVEIHDPLQAKAETRYPGGVSVLILYLPSNNKGYIGFILVVSACLSAVNLNLCHNFLNAQCAKLTLNPIDIRFAIA